MKRHGIVAQPHEELGAVFNPAIIRHDDGRFIMLARSVPRGYEKLDDINQFDNNYRSQLSLYEGSRPDQLKRVDDNAVMPDRPFDKYGVEDPRITRVGDKYYIFYTSLAIGLGEKDAAKGIRIAMASTRDFRSFKKHGVIGPDRTSKAGAIFESNGTPWFMWKDEQNTERFMMSPAPKDIENPMAWRKFWRERDIEGDVLLSPQENAYENLGTEPGAPPIETKNGLLMVYSSISRDHKWRISAMMLDKEDPSKILSKTEKPLLSPEKDYELKGDVNEVVFPGGALIERDRLYVYYGGADSVCAVASEKMSRISKALKPFADRPARWSDDPLWKQAAEKQKGR